MEIVELKGKNMQRRIQRCPLRILNEGSIRDNYQTKAVTYCGQALSKLLPVFSLTIFGHTSWTHFRKLMVQIYLIQSYFNLMSSNSLHWCAQTDRTLGQNISSQICFTSLLLACFKSLTFKLASIERELDCDRRLSRMNEIRPITCNNWVMQQFPVLDAISSTCSRKIYLKFKL